MALFNPSVQKYRRRLLVFLVLDFSPRTSHQSFAETSRRAPFRYKVQACLQVLPLVSPRAQRLRYTHPAKFQHGPVSSFLPPPQVSHPRLSPKGYSAILPSRHIDLGARASFALVKPTRKPQQVRYALTFCLVRRRITNLSYHPGPSTLLLFPINISGRFDFARGSASVTSAFHILCIPSCRRPCPTHDTPISRAPNFPRCLVSLPGPTSISLFAPYMVPALLLTT